MELNFKNIFYNNLLNDVNLSIKSGKIIGIYPNDILISIISGKLLPTQGVYSYNNININYKNIDDYLKKVSEIDLSNNIFYTTKVKDEIKYYFKINHIKLSSFDEIVNYYFNLIGFDSSYLKRSICSLSTTEKYMFNLFLKLITKPEIIIFNDNCNGLDKINKKRIRDILNILKLENKIIIFNSNNVDSLYSVTDELVLVKDKIIDFDDTKDIFTNTDTLINNDIEMPTLIKITYLAKKNKNIKLFYHTDVRDIIKDIYKHV